MKLKKYQKNIPLHKNGLFWEMGLGKTYSSLNFCLDKKFKKLIIICPKNLKKQWEDSLKKYPEVEALIYNAEQLKQEKWRKPEDIKNHFVIVDESHLTYKNCSSKRSKAYFNKLGRYLDSNQVLLLSGTPIKHSESDLFSQHKLANKYFKTLDGFLLTKKTDFEYYFFDFVLTEISSGRKFNQKVGVKEHLKKFLYAQFDSFWHKLSLESTNIDQIEKEYVKINIKPNKNFLDSQREILEGLLEIATNKKISLDSKIQAFTRVRELADGYFSIPDSDIIKNNNSLKIDALYDLVKKIPKNEKIIVLAPLIKTRNFIEESLKNIRKVGVIKDSKRESLEILEKFKNTNELDLLISSQKLVGTGVNLEVANHLIFFSNDYAFSDRIQAESRILRPLTQKKKCYIYDIFLEKSYDHIVNKILKNKENIHVELKNFCLENM